MWKKTALQLLKEFWIPALGATGWTIYVSLPAPTIAGVVTNFSTSFFLVAWATSQFFRVRKQAAVEGSFKTLEGRLTELVGKLEDETKELLNHMNGGDSFCTLIRSADNLKWFVLHHGKYHLRELTVTVRDLDVDWQSPDFLTAAFNSVEIGTLFTGFAKPCFQMPLSGGANRRRFKIGFDAANGQFNQALVLKQVALEKWVSASRVTRTTSDQQVITLYEQIDDDFPLEPDGTPGY